MCCLVLHKVEAGSSCGMVGRGLHMLSALQWSLVSPLWWWLLGVARVALPRVVNAHNAAHVGSHADVPVMPASPIVIISSAPALAPASNHLNPPLSPRQGTVRQQRCQFPWLILLRPPLLRDTACSCHPSPAALPDLDPSVHSRLRSAANWLSYFVVNVMMWLAIAPMVRSFRKQVR